MASPWSGAWDTVQGYCVRVSLILPPPNCTAYPQPLTPCSSQNTEQNGPQGGRICCSICLRNHPVSLPPRPMSNLSVGVPSSRKPSQASPLPLDVRYLFWWDPTFSCQWLFSSELQFWSSCRRRWAHALILHHLRNKRIQNDASLMNVLSHWTALKSATRLHLMWDK